MKIVISFISILSIYLSLGYAQTNTQIELLPSYTSNYYYDSSKVDSFFVDTTATVSSVKGAWDFSLAIGATWFADYAVENTVIGDTKLQYTVPVSLNIDILFVPVAYMIYYPENDYSGIAYGAECIFAYDSLLAFREELAVAYYNDVRPDICYDRQILTIELRSRWDISPETNIKHSIKYSKENWSELLTSENLIPLSDNLSTGLTLETMFSNSLSGIISVSYEKQSSTVESMLTIGDETFLETDSDSYTQLSVDARLGIYFKSFMFEPYCSYEDQLYDSRLAFIVSGEIGSDFISIKRLEIGFTMKTLLGYNHFIIMSGEYGMNETNDYYQNGSGGSIQGGILLNF